jgi:Fucose permease
MKDEMKVFIAGCIGMAFFGVAFIVLGSVLPALEAKYHLDGTQIAWLASVLPVGVLVGSLVFGPVVDKTGYQKLLIVSSAITGLGLLGLSMTDNIFLHRLFVFVIGLGGGVLNGETNALVAEVSTPEHRGARLSILGACYGVGALLMPMLLGACENVCSYEMILQGAALVMGLSIVYFATINFLRPYKLKVFH